MNNIPENCRELHLALQRGERTSVEITTHYLNEIEARNTDLNAFITVTSELALAKAAQIDEKRKRGETVGQLAGLPIAIKDNIITRDIKTTCASKMLENFVPPYNAHVMKRIEAEDGILLGKTNLDEFAMGSSTENSYFGPSKNPIDTSCVPGGSSGGTASAVGGKLAPFGLGSDTGGSIRQPSAFCGIVGLKPTYGRVSRFGLVAFASSLDQIGPMANDVYGTALLYDVISGYDDHDSTSINSVVEPTLPQLEDTLENLKVGILDDENISQLDEEMIGTLERAKSIYKDAGAEIVPIKLPHAKYAVATYYLIAPSEASSNLSRYDGVHYGFRAAEYKDLLEMYCQTRSQGFGDEVKRRIMLGTYALSKGYYDDYYLKALKVRRLIGNDFEAAFKEVDFLLSPVTPTPAFKIGEHVKDPMSMYLADIFTIGANLAGTPAVSVPCGTTSTGLPLGVQLIGSHLSESKLLRATRMLEAQLDG